MIPGQLTDPELEMPITVLMSFSLPWGSFEGRVTHCTALLTFLLVNRIQSCPCGKSNLAQAPRRVLRINLDRDAHLRTFSVYRKNNRLQISNPQK